MTSHVLMVQAFKAHAETIAEAIIAAAGMIANNERSHDPSREASKIADLKFDYVERSAAELNHEE